MADKKTDPEPEKKVSGTKKAILAALGKRESSSGKAKIKKAKKATRFRR
jgi:hypothetical protein